MDSKELAVLSARIIDRHKGSNILVLDIAPRSAFADYMIIATGSSVRQIGALQEELEEALEKQDIFARSVEGPKDSGWILLDYGDVVINLMTIEMRDKYHIETVWGDCAAVSLDE